MDANEQLEQERSQLLLLGLNCNYDRAYYLESKGEMERIAKGVYVSTRLGPQERKQLLIKNSARIAMRLFPDAMLAGSSAFHRGAVEGHLLLAQPQFGRNTDVGGAFTIIPSRNELDLGLNREVEFVTLEDSFGEYAVKRVADELLILKNFMQVRGRPRATYLSNADLNRVVERCMRHHGGRRAFLKRMEELALHHGMANYVKRIKDFCENVGIYEQELKPLQSFNVHWHRLHVATLAHDGHVWSFEYEPNVQLQLSLNERKGKGTPPSFLGSLLPEAGVKVGETMEENLGDFRRGHRYISNITVKPTGTGPKLDKAIIIDMLDGEIKDWSNSYIEFKGQVHPDIRMALSDGDLMDSIQRDPDCPRMSGMQIKLPGFLDRTGMLMSARNQPFTHIIKVVGSNPMYSSMCSMEWFSLTVAKALGMKTENFAIADLGGHGPSLIAERFDVRHDLNDRRMILTEDFWSMAGMVDNRQKYAGELMDVADVLIKHSTNKDEDGRHLLAQAMFSWLTFNGDLHLKNLLIVKETRDPRRGFENIRLSPAYDVLCTQVYPDDAKNAAIGLAGSRNHTLAGFRQLGEKFGIKASEVDSLLDFLSTGIPSWARKVAENLPATVRNHEQSVKHIEQARHLFDLRCMMMLSELEAAKKSRGKLKVEETFSAENDSSLLEHAQAERRRSGAPMTMATPAKRAGHRP